MSNPKLKKELGLFTMVALGVGSILGSGIFGMPAAMGAVAGPSLILAILITAVISFFLGMPYAELGSAFPLSGGPYSFPRLAMGADMGDAPSDKGFVNWVFSPPVKLEPDEYIFGWQQRGVQSCNSNDCDTIVNRSFKVFFEFTGINNGSSGWGIGADNT
ncbi:MAG: putative transporter, partial [Candidatus Anoxychlamydiales bacterium]|nr:putative transporter [Candidatus Anoxychlamydiales bacterium]